MSKRDVVVKADKVRKWHKLGRFAKIAILLLLLLRIIQEKLMFYIKKIMKIIIIS